MSTATTPEWFTFTSSGSDPAPLEIAQWLPADPPRASMVIAHGASEHAMRYDRLAQALVTRGWAVYGVDHRGHGRTADRHGTFGVARPGGWDAMVADLVALTRDVHGRHPDVPLVLLGHSMGSFLSQRAFQLDGNHLAAVVLSGSAGSLEGSNELLPMLSQIEEAEGAEAPSAVFAAMFAGFNEAFATDDDATGFEWLSRDRSEVQLYVDDPWCGQPLSNGFVSDMVTGMAALWDPEAEAQLPTNVPVLLMSGEADPVGEDGASVRALAQRYHALGIDVTTMLYVGARHELLNETNRNQVQADLVGWLENLVASS